MAAGRLLDSPLIQTLETQETTLLAAGAELSKRYGELHPAVIKNSAVALTIGLMELTARARAMQEFTFQVFEAFTAATIIYIVINIIVTFAMRYVEQRVAVPGLIGAKPAVSTH